MKKILLTFSVLLVPFLLFTACSVPVPKISWEMPNTEPVDSVATTLTGVLFPFDVSVATKATHRLEADNKLVALIASDIVNLPIFEGRMVDVTGFSKSEGTRNVFWVHSIDLKEDLSSLPNEDVTFTDQYLPAKDFTFLYPKKWDMFIAPDGAYYFSEKGDVNRRSFFTFSVEPLTEEVKEADEEKPKNVLIAGLEGTKQIITEEKKEQQIIELFSADETKKYVFKFNSYFEEFEKKNQFFSLLNSFVVGESKVEKVITTRKKKVADLKGDLLKKQNELSEIRSQLEALKLAEEQKLLDGTLDEEKKTLFDRLINFTQNVQNLNTQVVIDSAETKTKETDEMVETPVEDDEKVEIKTQKDVTNFTNLIDGRSYPYTSNYLKLSLKIPYGFWYQNFGAVNNTIATIAAQKSPIEGLAGADFKIEILERVGGVSAVTEKEEGDMTIIEMPRPNFRNSFIRISGATKFRDAMHSVRTTIY